MWGVESTLGEQVDSVGDIRAGIGTLRGRFESAAVKNPYTPAQNPPESRKIADFGRNLPPKSLWVYLGVYVHMGALSPCIG